MKVAPHEIQDAIISEQYHVFPGTQTTVCCLVLQNGFTALGSSACVDPAEYDEGIGRTVARKKAEDEVWKVLGFRLAERLMAGREG